MVELTSIMTRGLSDSVFAAIEVVEAKEFDMKLTDSNGKTR